MPILHEYWDEDLYFHYTVDKNPDPAAFGRHVHDEYEIFYFISGKAKFFIEGTEYPLIPGQVYVIRPVELHKIQVEPGVPYERISMHFSKKILEPLDPDGLLLEPFDNRLLGQENYYTSDDLSPLIPDKLFRRMCIKDTDTAKRMNILIHLYPLLGMIRTVFYRRRAQTAVSPENGQAKEIIEYINSHLYEDLSLEALSTQFFVSVSQLNRLFKQATSSTIWEYVLLKRLTTAKNLIKNGTAAMEASHICGFKDYSSFYRAYVKKFGISPSQDKNAGASTVML